LQLIKVIPHGYLAKLYEPVAIAATTAAEAIEGWGRQFGQGSVPVMQKHVVEVIDFDTDEKLAAKTDVTEIHLVPAMLGGGGGIGKIIIGGVLIVAGVLVSAIPGMQVLGTALISAGIGMVIGGVMQLFMKSPSVSKEDDPEASKYIGTGKNTTAIGTLIGIGGGRMLIGGQFLSLQVNSSELVHGSFPATPT
jgi:predicted phage tail protein